MLKKLIKEPLLHFLLLGGLLFALRGGDEAAPAVAADEPSHTVVINTERIRSIRDGFTDYWRRPPTEAELDKLVEDYVTEEVLYREARRVGLDKEDPIIRARLAHEMGMLAETDLERLSPTDSDLRAYLAENPEEYRRGDRCSLRQLFFGPADNPENAARAEETLSTLHAADEDAPWKNLGDPIGLPTILERLRWREVGGLFGEDFQAQIQQAPVERWFGPITSNYGTHLVYLIEREEGYIPDFEDVRAIVARDWEAAELLKRRDAHFAELRAKYDITVESLPPEAPETPDDAS